MLLVGILTALTYYFIYQFMFDYGREQGRLVAAMARVAITEQMAKPGNHNDNMRALLELFQKIPGLNEIRLLRGGSVEKQFGAATNNAMAVEDVEKQMLSEHKITEQLKQADGRILFHYNSPLIASANGSQNCLQCHHVAEGEVLGGVSVQFDLTKIKEKSISSLFIVLAVIILIGILMYLLMSYFLTPIVNIADSLSLAVSHAEQGNFEDRLKRISDDEIGDIADTYNRLMETFLVHMGQIISDAESLTGFQDVSRSSNILEHSVSVVHGLVEGARFKEGMRGDRDLDELYARLKAELIEELGLKEFALYNVNPMTDQLEVVFVEGLPDEGVLAWWNLSLKGNAGDYRTSRATKNINGMSDVSEGVTQFYGRHEQKYVCLAIMGSEDVSGILQVVYQEGMYAEIEEKMQFLRYYLSVAGSEIEAKKILASFKATSLRDPLTGLHNRRYLDELQVNLTASIKRRGSSLGILMCDVDHFKHINDTYGHDIGDLVLKEISALLVDEVRASDYVVRFGGEEIVVLITDAIESDVLSKADQLCKAVQDKTYMVGEKMINKTISIGVSMFPIDVDSFDECLKCADIALYAAKNSGRNKVVRYEP